MNSKEHELRRIARNLSRLCARLYVLRDTGQNVGDDSDSAAMCGQIAREVGRASVRLHKLASGGQVGD